MYDDYLQYKLDCFNSHYTFENSVWVCPFLLKVEDVNA